MTTAEFLRALETTLELEPETITGKELLADVEWWDSMATLSFMAVADQELRVIVTGDQLANCKSVSDLLSLLGDKVSS
jgi:acyl carrier protein